MDLEGRALFPQEFDGAAEHIQKCRMGQRR